jgi:hypothetical protein
MLSASALSHRVYNPADVGCMLISVGPDGYLGAEGYNYKGWLTPSRELQYSMYTGAYDPSNGTISAGNIYLGLQMGGLDATGRTLLNKCYPPDLN